MNSSYKIRIPPGLIIACVYLLISGITGFVLLFLAIKLHSELGTQISAYRAGVYTRNGLLALAFLTSGMGLLFRKSWARKMALIILVVDAVYGGASFARGYAQGEPSSNMLLISYFVSGGWGAIWFYLVYRKSSADFLNQVFVASEGNSLERQEPQDEDVT